MRIVQLVLPCHALRSPGEFPTGGVGELPPNMIFVGGNSSTLKINFLPMLMLSASNNRHTSIQQLSINVYNMR